MLSVRGNAARALCIWSLVAGCTASSPDSGGNRALGVAPPPSGTAGQGGTAAPLAGRGGAGALVAGQGGTAAPLAGQGGTMAPPIGGGAGEMVGTAGTGAPPSSIPSNETIPCDVATVITNRCHECHGAALMGGAPMHLITHADFHADLVVKTTRGLAGQTMKAYELARQRINAMSLPMPPGGPLVDAELATLDGWLAAGAPAGTSADASCMGTVEPPVVTDPPVTTDPTETCYDLPMHGGQTPGDTSPFTIPSGERYHCFTFAVPWTEPVVATRFANDFDNTALLHHWLLYTTNTSTDGAHAECSGSHIGDNSQLLSGWAVGGQDLAMPADTGLEMPAPGSKLLIEWHLYNIGGAATPDTSAVKICTVPKATRANIGGITSLGTEDFGFGIPVGMESEYSSTCVPSRAGMNGTDPIHIFAFLPHMHFLGRNMRSVVNRAGGGPEEVFNELFDFNQQIHHEVSIDLYPGDTISSTCTFFNDTQAAVTYGSSTTQEMCYQFALSSPVGALNNGAFGWNGSTTNCW